MPAAQKTVSGAELVLAGFSATQAAPAAAPRQRTIMSFFSMMGERARKAASLKYYAINFSITWPPNWLSCLKRPAW